MPQPRVYTNIFVIDVQNDFLPGGNLPVPEGNEVKEPLRRWLSSVTGATIITTCDYHEGSQDLNLKHMSFASKYPIENDEGEVHTAEPVISSMLHDQEGNIIAIKEHGDKDFFKVEQKANGNYRKTAEVDAGDVGIEQILWPDHCVQGTPGANLRGDIGLPVGFVKQVNAGHAQYDYKDTNQNTLIALFKGMNRGREQYGPLQYTNGELATTMIDGREVEVREIFAKQAQQLKSQGYSHVEFCVAGVATNFCVQNTIDQVRETLTPVYNEYGIELSVSHVHDASRGIAAIPDEAPVSMKNIAVKRAADGVTEKASTDIRANPFLRQISFQKELRESERGRAA